MTEQYALFRRYLEIDDDCYDLVRRAAPAILSRLDWVVERFYERIRSHREAMARFPGGETQLARQELALRDWLRGVLEVDSRGQNDGKQLRVGRVHLDAAINEELMVAAINWLRSDLAYLAHHLELPEGVEPVLLAAALSRLMDYNLALMLTSYWRTFQERAMRLDRLAMIGQFTATINHELRNPLGVIGTSSFLLRQRLESIGVDEQAMGHIDKITRSIDRANSIISGLLRLLRIEQPERKKLSLTAFVEDVRKDIVAQDGQEIEYRLPDASAYGIFDPVQVSQVLHNLIRNASEAMPGGGRILVTASNDPTAAEFSVQDDGPGISNEDRSRIFDPLFTSKSFGTGLGLTLAKSIIDSHGGSLQLTPGLDEQGVGFLIRLPHYFGPIHN